MSITAAARAEHETLFPDHVSTLAQSDPDLIEIFDNLTFDDLVREMVEADRASVHSQGADWNRSRKSD